MRVVPGLIIAQEACREPGGSCRVAFLADRDSSVTPGSLPEKVTIESSTMSCLANGCETPS